MQGKVNYPPQFNHRAHFDALRSPEYITERNILTQILRDTRNLELYTNPIELLNVQKTLADLVFRYQSERKQAKNDNNKTKEELYNRLISICKQIGNCIAWRIFDYNRNTLAFTSDHNRTGHLDNSTPGDFQAAKEIIQKEGKIVIVNDITEILRYGDLTVIGSQGPRYPKFLENKPGGLSKVKDKRGRAQLDDINAIENFLRTGTRENPRTPGVRDYIYPMDHRFETYHQPVQKLFDEARQSGYVVEQLSDCVKVEIVYLPGADQTQLKFAPQKFKGLQNVLTYKNIGFNKPQTIVAPYGIFPLPEEDCMALMTGEFILSVSLDFEALQRAYQEFNIELTSQNLTEDDIARYASSPLEDIHKMQDFWEFTLRRGDIEFTTHFSHFARVGIELLNERSLAFFDSKGIANLNKFAHDLGLPPQNVNLFTETNGEKELWV